MYQRWIFYKLFNLKKDYEKLGYSSNDVFIHLLKLTTTPILYGILVILSATIMFGINNKNSILLLLSLGLLISVGIYYMNFFFTSLGSTGKIPLVLSVFFPYLIISIISLIGLIGINEK